jgi:hypothetical protein
MSLRDTHGLPDGYELRVHHYHKPEDLALFERPNRGAPPRYVTVANVIGAGSVCYAQGTARCAPGDSPSRRLGYQIAKERALRAFRERQHEVEGTLTSRFSSASINMEELPKDAVFVDMEWADTCIDDRQHDVTVRLTPVGKRQTVVLRFSEPRTAFAFRRLLTTVIGDLENARAPAPDIDHNAIDERFAADLKRTAEKLRVNRVEAAKRRAGREADLLRHVEGGPAERERRAAQALNPTGVRK